MEELWPPDFISELRLDACKLRITISLHFLQTTRKLLLVSLPLGLKALSLLDKLLLARVYFRWRRTSDGWTARPFLLCRKKLLKHANQPKSNNTPSKRTVGSCTEQNTTVFMLRNFKEFYNQKNRCSSARLENFLEPTTLGGGRRGSPQRVQVTWESLGTHANAALWNSEWLTGGASIHTVLPQNARTARLAFIVTKLGSGLWT